ncbi:hypothetical protein AcW1_008665 [Taiwanofungus camphoratus]|nr:hypothetical protein AcV7_003851 [Antrodia cinnamomea]KAI0948926.1 hypothetical protein AcW1_008665 [Antrodia cinnamomea]
MTRRNSHRGRGGHRGSPQGSQFRGRGRGQGRGRGRGNAPSKGQSEGGNLSHTDDFDFPVQMWPNNEPPSRGSGTPGSRGRGRGSNSRPEPGFVIPRRGFGGPRGQGRGRGDLSENSPYGVGRERRRRGFLKSKLRADEPLSKLLYEDRPLLKPITFVRSVHTATLFQQEEDILQPISDTVDIAGDEQSHVPTADKVTQVFNEALVEATEADIASANGQLEEIDFTDVGRLQAEVDATSALNVTEKTEDGEPGVGAGGSRLTARGFVTTAEEPAVAVEEMATGFYVDTSPTSLEAPQAEESIIVDRMEGVLGDTSQEEEEIIVYVAPHPRCGRAKPPSRGATTSPAVHPRTSSVISLTAHDQLPKPPTNNDVTEAPVIPIPPSFESISFSFNETPRKKQARRTFPVGGPRSLLKRSKRIRRKSLRGFSSFGAMMSEAHLQEEVRERDPRQSEQRRGDSDVNWGDSDSDAVGIAGDAIEDLSTGFGAMELDGEMSLEAMKSFVDSMSADGSRHITMDDIADLERMKREDADELDDKGNTHSSDGESGGSVNEEVELVVNAEERALIGEDIDEDEDEDDESSDDEDTPRTGFKARLAKIRANAKGKQKEEMYAHSSDEAMSVQMTWADKDEDFFAKIEKIQTCCRAEIGKQKNNCFALFKMVISMGTNLRI